MPAKISIFCKSNSILSIGDFRGVEFESEDKNSKIQNDGSNMAAKILIVCKSNSILPKGFFGVPESESKVKIAKFKISDPICRPINRFFAN